MKSSDGVNKKKTINSIQKTSVISKSRCNQQSRIRFDCLEFNMLLGILDIRNTCDYDVHEVFRPRLPSIFLLWPCSFTQFVSFFLYGTLFSVVRWLKYVYSSSGCFLISTKPYIFVGPVPFVCTANYLFLSASSNGQEKGPWWASYNLEIF